MLAEVIEAAINVARFRSVRTSRKGSGECSTSTEMRVSSIFRISPLQAYGRSYCLVMLQIKSHG